MSEDIKCSFCGASLLNDDAEIRGILQAENDVLCKQLDEAMKSLNYLDFFLKYKWQHELIADTITEIAKIGGEK